MSLPASIHIGPVGFDQPLWLVLIPVLCGLAVLMALGKSLSGLGSVTRWVALAVRLLVIVLLAGAMAEPSWRKESRKVAVIVVSDMSQSVPAQLQEDLKVYAKAARDHNPDPEDELGQVTAAKDAYVQALPRALNKELQYQHVGAVDGTNLEAALRLGLATAPKESATRIVLATDGNQTAGNVLRAAEMARTLGVPVDVLPFRYRYDQEVLVERFATPATAREGETINLRVVLNAVKPTAGTVQILMNGETMDLDPEGPGLGARVTLKEGANVLQLPVKVARSGPQRFEAVFEPDVAGGRVQGDSVLENNKSMSVTFVQGEGRLLVVAMNPDEARYFLGAMDESKIRTQVISPAQFPKELTDLNAFDAVVLFNAPAYEFTQSQQEQIRQYVHDTGGGLMMVGGPNSFGAGGWIGTPVEDALPVKMDPPQKRQMPRGALALVMHSVEAPDGVFLGKKTCEAAVNALSRLDYIGIIEFRGFGSEEWVHALAPVGDGTAVKRSIQSLVFGDMPDFAPSLELAYEGLMKVQAGQRHVIMISDGDPTQPPTTLLDKYVKAGITISTVGIYPHSGGDTSRMQYISNYAKGRHYHINTAAGLASVPQIFIKEAQTVRRSLIQESPPIVPSVQGGASESLRGVTGVPALTGWVVTAEREGLAYTAMKVGKENDPVFAQWQYGLGKAIAFTSDAASRWNQAWVEWGGYRSFWEQQVRWIMRPGDSANVRMTTENRGDETVITVHALDSAGDPLNFAVFQGRLAMPDGTGRQIELRQDGPGRYRGVVPTGGAGSYVASLRYAAPDAAQTGGVIEGSIQGAITRPFADEFKTLQDNAPLLAQVAELTGGRVLEWDAARDNLWRREGLKFPVAKTPIWLGVGVFAIGLFLMDVAVRRVRIDIPAIAGWAAGLFKGARVKAGEQMGGLKAAREQARQKMEGRGAGAPPAGGAERLAAHAAAEVAKVKFEASAEQLRRPTAPIVEAPAAAPAGPRPAPAQPGATQQQKPGEGMSRLLKAKQKAREEMEE